MTSSLAGLPMYDFPELRPATDAFWTAVATRLRAAGLTDVPEILTRPENLTAFWRDDRLLLSQTCGYPLMTGLRGAVRLVATPVYAAPGCRGAWHGSVIVTGVDSPAQSLEDLRGGVCAFNGPDSNTGMNLLRASIAPLANGRPFFRSIVETGAHVASLWAVAEGRADAAAIDCVTFEHMRRHRPETIRRVRTIAMTPLTPGLPFIASAATDDATLAVLRDSLDGAAADPELSDVREALLIERFERLDESAYAIILDFEEQAVAAGYPTLV